MLSRRRFIQHTTFASGMLAVSPSLIQVRYPNSSHIACQQYTWITYFKREGKEWGKNMDESMKSVIESGLTGFEPSFSALTAVEKLKPYLTKYKVWTQSLYVNATLHEEQEVSSSIEQAIDIAKAAKKLGVRIVVSNPSPIRWGGPENKTDKQLQIQAKALDELGKKLREMRMVLAYHNHDAEMREGAREFHHMMNGTDPANVKLCLDAHWIYRGAGNSEVALFDIVNLYADRVVELHLRQSHDGIWSEVFESGDIDYTRLAEELRKRKLNPHIVIEQAVEEGTPHTMNAIEAHRKSLAYTAEIFPGS